MGHRGKMPGLDPGHAGHALLGRAPRALEVTGRHRDLRGCREDPAGHVVVGGDLRRLHRLVVQRGGRGQVPADRRAQRLRARIRGVNWTWPVARATATPRAAWRIESSKRSIRYSAHARRLTASRGRASVVVGELVEARAGLVGGRARLGDQPGVRAAVREHRRRRREQRGLAEGASGGESAPGHVAHPLELDGEERAGREVQQHGHRLARALVGKRLQGRDEPPLRGLVAPEEVLAGGARGREPDAKADVVAGNELDRLEQRGRGSARGRRWTAAPARASIRACRRAGRSSSGISRSAAAYQRAAPAGALAAFASPASRSSSIAACSPRTPDCST